MQLGEDPPDALVRGIAASAFDTGRPDADAVLAAVAAETDPAALRARIDACRAAEDWGLGRSPAPRERAGALRKALAGRGLDGCLVPLADEHLGEFIPLSARRLAWLTGFTGSAGLAVVLADKAAVFVDGRYEIQAAAEVDDAVFEILHVARRPPVRWLEDNAPPGGRVGYDPWLHAEKPLERLEEACRRAGARLVAMDANPVDLVWTGKPPPPLGPVTAHDLRHAGVDAAEKRRETGRAVGEAGCDAAVLSAPDSIAWLLNVRGSDVGNAPLPLGYAILRRDGAVAWFVDPRKIAAAVRDGLGAGASILEPGALGGRLDALGAEGAVVRLDPDAAPAWLPGRLRAAGATVSPGADPCALPKARKNDVEIRGARACHVRDGAAFCRFLAWLAREAPGGGVTERAAADRLLAFRGADPAFRGASFETISGAGPNGAVVHYHATAASDRALRPGDVYLVDSGGQYPDGTTDVTRTVYIDGGPPPPDEIRDRFTRVLKGHVAIATAKFPAGTTGGQLDALARRPLWDAGLDYDHGTGHGVGSYLGVHEGPQRVSKTAGGAALEPGMILSNEPGCYEAGAYGIRIENLVIARAEDGGGREMLSFETITLAPIDRGLVAPALLAPEERAWLDAYHARVREVLSPLVDDRTRAWLAAATAGI